MAVLIHAANVLYLLSYLVKDILWLRVVTVVAGLLLLTDYVLHDAWVPISWNCVFTAVNLVQIQRLLLERRPVVLTPDEQRVYQLAFRSLTPREAKKLLAFAKWEDAREGERIVTKGRELDRMMVIVSGKTSVENEGRTIVELGEGRFVGEMSFLTGEPPSADVVARADTKLVSWAKDELRRFLQEMPDLRASMQMLIGTDLVAKLKLA